MLFLDILNKDKILVDKCRGDCLNTMPRFDFDDRYWRVYLPHGHIDLKKRYSEDSPFLLPENMNAWLSAWKKLFFLEYYFIDVDQIIKEGYLDIDIKTTTGFDMYVVQAIIKIMNEGQGEVMEDAYSYLSTHPDLSQQETGEYLFFNWYLKWHGKGKIFNDHFFLPPGREIYREEHEEKYFFKNIPEYKFNVLTKKPSQNFIYDDFGIWNLKKDLGFFSITECFNDGAYTA